MPYCKTAPRSINLKITTLAAITVILTGCATPLTREDRIGPDDGSDVCRPNVVALDSTGNFFAEDMIKGAVAGAVTGGVAALLTGGSGRDAVAAAVAGAVIGAVGGYYKSRMDQGRDQAVLRINEDLSREAGQLDKTDTAVRALITCRIKQRDRIRADYAAGRISRGDAQRRWSLLQEQVRRDNNLMQMVAENIGKRQEEYRYANEQVAAEFDISRLPPAQQREARRRIDANDRMIDQEYRRELAEIDRDAAKARKSSSGRKPSPELEKEREQRRVAAEKARNTKKEVNRKTGGQQNAVRLASNFSSTQNKAENTVRTAKNYQTEVAVSEGGFEKTSLLENLDGPVYTLRFLG